METYMLFDESNQNVLKYSNSLNEVVEYALSLERANVGWLEDLTISRFHPNPEILYFGRGILDYKDTPL